MICSGSEPLTFIKSLQHGPYSSSIASSASSSSASVWSDASSQSSDDTSLSACVSEPIEQCDSYCPPSVAQTSEAISAHATTVATSVPTELRQNPRRTCSGATARNGCPPALTRQCDRKVDFVDSLVDSATHIVEAIWPRSSVPYRADLGAKAVLPLRTFIQETLRRSRTSYSTLQVALYYLILIKPHVPSYDFTMEQPDDLQTSRALQCGRRMFLAALILASKYIQDRNYSARAWSKISGLPTQEINENEMAFLLSVNWKLHITEQVFKLWTNIVLKHASSPPVTPGSTVPVTPEQQIQDWKNIILKLNPDLDNIEGLIPLSTSKISSQDMTPVSPRSLLSAAREPTCTFGGFDSAADVTPKSYAMPSIMEPSPATVYTPGRLAPALGLLPTPRLTPQTTGFSTPAASAASCMLSGKASMGFAMAQAANSNAAQNLDRWPVSNTPSPQNYFLQRRSSLANSISTASSPESMISDSSRTSRSSSISSASSLVSAPSIKLDVQARCRHAKLWSERYSLRPVIASVPEDYEENYVTSSPESYAGPVGKDFMDVSMETPLARRACEADDAASAASAARVLQDLYNQRIGFQSYVGAKTGSKRSRPVSTDNSVQDRVRDMLTSSESAWRTNMLRSSHMDVDESEPTNGGRKRVCYSSENQALYNIPAMHPAAGGPGGVGMWEGILN